MSQGQPQDRPQDNRTLVDRTLDRIRNNRVAAVFILVALGLGTLASVTDSVSRLWSVLPSFSSISAVGEWKSERAEFYPAGPEFMRLHLQEVNGDVLGVIQFSGNEAILPRKFDILDGKREGTTVTIAFDGGMHSIGTDGKSTPLRETLNGELAGEELRLVYRRQNHGGVPITARRIAQADQLVDGKLAIVYKGKEYADPAAACTQLLQDLDPAQTYQQSEAPDEYGNVHCVGKQADGTDGFDMRMNDVQQQIICPANSLVTRTESAQSQQSTLKRCECDGRLLAVDNQCAGSEKLQ
jgi:hypothetical protein